MATQLPYHYTGADYYALCSDAMLKAITRQTAAVDAKIAAINADGRRHPISTANFFDHHARPEDVAVVVSEADFVAANAELVPSVSAGELARYETMRASFDGAGQDGPAAAAGGQQQDAPRPPSMGARVVSGSSTASARAKARTAKGKGKALAVDSSEDDDEGGRGVNGAGRAKGKGKAAAAFEADNASDDDGLY